MQADWVARYIKRHGGTNGQWMGYHGPRDADPRSGNSGYNPPEGEAASTLPAGHGLTNDYGNLHMYTPGATAGGPAEAGLIALAHHVQDTEGGAACNTTSTPSMIGRTSSATPTASTTRAWPSMSALAAAATRRPGNA